MYCDTAKAKTGVWCGVNDFRGKLHSYSSSVFVFWAGELDYCDALRPQKPHIAYREGERGGGCMVGYLWTARPCAPTRKGRRDRRPLPEQYVKEVGTPPVRSSLRTPQLAVSTAARDKVTKTESETPAAGTWNKRQSSSLWEPNSTSLFRSLLGSVHVKIHMVLNVHRQ